MKTILEEIVQNKRNEVSNRQSVCPLASLQRACTTVGTPRRFRDTLVDASVAKPAIIGEIKRGSPSLGCVRPDLDVVAQASDYVAGGASALSVLTDKDYFYADDSDFETIRNGVAVPMLRKEFIVDSYQVYESRALGADCILLIMSILSDDEAADLATVAHELGMDVLAEAHSAEELTRILDHIPYDLVGINNRNLRTFETSYKHTLELAEHVPDKSVLVAESGLKSRDAIRDLWEQGIGIFLVGEAFVTSSNPKQTVSSFVNI